MELLFTVETVNDGVQGAFLPACQLEGEGGPNLHDSAQVDLPLVSPEFLVLPALDHAQAEGEQLQNLHFTLGLEDGGEFLGQVQCPQVLHDGGEVQVVRQFPGAKSRQGQAWKLENGLVEPPEKFLFHAGFAAGFAYRIDRQYAAAEFLVVVEGLHVGVAHLKPTVFSHYAGYQPFCAVLDSLCPVACALEKQQAYFAGAVGKGGHETVSTPADNSRADDGPDKHSPFSGLAVLDGSDLGLV